MIKTFDIKGIVILVQVTIYVVKQQITSSREYTHDIAY